MSEKDLTPAFPSAPPADEAATPPDRTAVEAAEMVAEGAPADPASAAADAPSAAVVASRDEAEAAPEAEPLDAADAPDWPVEEQHPPGVVNAAVEPAGVDAALAALRALPTLADAPTPADPGNATTTTLPQPPLLPLERGTMASVIPALLMIAAGVFLTFYLASGNPMPAPQQLAGGALVIAGLSLLSWWLQSGRWATGSLFLGLLSAAGGAALILL